jgi:hypothetical protein
MQVSYKGIMYPWICTANPWIHTELWPRIPTPKRFASCVPKWILIYLDSQIWILNVFKRFGLWIQFVLLIFKDSTNPPNQTNPHKSLVHRQVRICTNPGLQICESLWWSKDLFRGFDLVYCFQKICFEDSIWYTGFKRLVSGIRFGTPKFSKDSIHFYSEGFVYKSCSLTLNPFWVDSWPTEDEKIQDLRKKKILLWGEAKTIWNPHNSLKTINVTLTSHYLIASYALCIMPIVHEFFDYLMISRH